MGAWGRWSRTERHPSDIPPKIIHALVIRSDDDGVVRRPPPLTPLVGLFAAVASALAISACGVSSNPGPSTGQPGPVASTTPSPGPRSESAGVKPPLAGLIDMGVQTPYQLDLPFPTVDTAAITPYAGSFAGIVVNETWAQLEPAQGNEDWSPLDASLAAVRQWNATHSSTPVGVKLRIFAGNTAPDWAKALGGPSVTVATTGVSKTYGAWWTAPYRQAWSSFQHAMAARYDSNPLVQAVSAGSCATLTGEPFVMNLTRPAIQVMEAAGWTPQAQESCLQGVLADYSGWVRTPVDFAFNPYRTVVAGAAVPDQSFTDQVMQACSDSRSHGGPTCVLGNNGLSATAATDRSGPVYAQIDALWRQTPGRVGVYFQTVGSGVDCGAIDVAVSYHASSVELWPPNHGYRGFAGIPSSTLARWNGALRSGSSLTCSA